MIQEGNIVNASNNINPKLSGEIYDGINYICKLNNCRSIKDLFSNQYKEFLVEHKKQFEENKLRDIESYDNNALYKNKVEEREYQEPSRWEIVNALTEKV